MALNDAAADAALDMWIASINPPPANAAITKDVMRPLIRAIYAGIVANAVVLPAGAPTPLTAPNGGGAVSGTGKIG